jgi:hypothetical protein
VTTPDAASGPATASLMITGNFVQKREKSPVIMKLSHGRESI